MAQFNDTFGVLLNVDKVVKIKYGNYNERLRWELCHMELQNVRRKNNVIITRKWRRNVVLRNSGVIIMPCAPLVMISTSERSESAATSSWIKNDTDVLKCLADVTSNLCGCLIWPGMAGSIDKDTNMNRYVCIMWMIINWPLWYCRVNEIGDNGMC